MIESPLVDIYLNDFSKSLSRILHLKDFFINESSAKCNRSGINMEFYNTINQQLLGYLSSFILFQDNESWPSHLIETIKLLEEFNSILNEYISNFSSHMFCIETTKFVLNLSIALFKIISSHQISFSQIFRSESWANIKELLLENIKRSNIDYEQKFTSFIIEILICLLANREYSALRAFFSNIRLFDNDFKKFFPSLAQFLLLGYVYFKVNMHEWKENKENQRKAFDHYLKISNFLNQERNLLANDEGSVKISYFIETLQRIEGIKKVEFPLNNFLIFCAEKARISQYHWLEFYLICFLSNQIFRKDDNNNDPLNDRLYELCELKGIVDSSIFSYMNKQK